MNKILKRGTILLMTMSSLILSSCGKSSVVNDDVQTNYYMIEYELNGHGQTIDSANVEDQNLLTKPSDPNESGWTFDGWYTDEELTKAFDFDSKVTSSFKLYAKWVKSYDYNKTPTIYLAGDSTVQTYADNQYIGGWGQYLSYYLDDSVKVVNAARGGRSSRSFINEGRLFSSSSNYSFSENGGKAIEDTIEEGDYLFIQFGHNDDDTKGYNTMADRMVPLGDADSSGIYPTVAPGEKKSTTYLPQKYLDEATSQEVSTMKTEISKYGDTYYAYGDGTYKWYLKQYIDLARKKGATPVLCTPVARVSFNTDGTLKSGAGLHGEDFAYVKAVRQLAEEEDCLLIDNFSFTKELLETTTSSYSDFLMALVPNTLDNGPWPSGYDTAYKNTDAGYEKIEATHYNKYGAYLTAGYVCESILNSKENCVVKENGEYFDFSNNVLTTPKNYVDPSNRISISKVKEIESLLTKINVTNPNRSYVQPETVILAINNLKSKGELSSIDSTNYLEWDTYCKEARAVYDSLNYDYRSKVTNLNVLEEYENKVLESRPLPKKTVVLSASDYTNSSTPVVKEDTTFSFDSNITSYQKKSILFMQNNNTYEQTTQSIRLAGNAKITTSPTKYIEFNVTGKCEITIVASGGGDTSRYIQMANKENKLVTEFEIEATQTKVTQTITDAGVYKIGSKGSNIDVYYIIIEYFE